MSVRIQFFTVVVPLSRIRAIAGLEQRLHQKYQGFQDEHLWSVSSMAPPSDVGDYLASEGLVLREEVNGVRTWRDMCVVDYYEGPTNPCPWLEVDMHAHVAWLKGSPPGAIVGPTPHEPAPFKLMPTADGFVPTMGPPSSAPAARAPAPHAPAATANPSLPGLLADARSNATAITVLYTVLSVSALGAILFSEYSRFMTSTDEWGYSPYHPQYAAVFLLVPIALAAYRLFVAQSLGPDALMVHYRPISLEVQEGRVLGSMGLTIASIFAAGNEQTDFWAPWLIMPIVAYMLCGWDSTIIERGVYRASPFFRPTPLGTHQVGFVLVRGRGVRVALFLGRTPTRSLTQVAAEPDAVALAFHLNDAYGIPPALKRGGQR
jgi:hypothetical protein